MGNGVGHNTRDGSMFGTLKNVLNKDWQKNARRGAYIVKKGSDNPDVTILATGSEVDMALDATKLVTDKSIRVVSVFDLTKFSNDEKLQKEVIGKAKRVIVAEAASKTGWEAFAKKGDLFTLNNFGESGPATKVAEHLGFTAEKLADLIKK